MGGWELAVLVHRSKVLGLTEFGFEIWCVGLACSDGYW